MTAGAAALVERPKRNSFLEKDARPTTTIASAAASVLSTTRTTSPTRVQPQPQQQEQPRTAIQILEEASDPCGTPVPVPGWLGRVISAADVVGVSTQQESPPEPGENADGGAAGVAYICDVCVGESNTMEVCSCCGVKICLLCFEEYLEGRVMAGATRIECVNCDRVVSAHVVLRILTRNGRLRVRDEFARLLRGDKKCPRCQLILAKFDGSSCPQCGLNWCFRCEATHDGVNCDLFTAVHRNQIKSWAKSMSEGQWNAQRCPRCKVYIQRASGCDHMHCAHCHTHFCYRCGGRLRHMKFFGDHYSKLSVFGCKYKYKPNKPIQRKLIRSAVFVARLVAIPLAGVGALCGIALLALLAVPMYAGYRVHRNVASRTNSNEKAPETAGQADDDKMKAEINESEIFASSSSSSSSHSSDASNGSVNSPL